MHRTIFCVVPCSWKWFSWGTLIWILYKTLWHLIRLADHSHGPAHADHYNFIYFFKFLLPCHGSKCSVVGSWTVRRERPFRQIGTNRDWLHRPEKVAQNWSEDSCAIAIQGGCHADLISAACVAFLAKLSSGFRTVLSADQIKSAVVFLATLYQADRSLWLLNVAEEWVVIIDLFRLSITELFRKRTCFRLSRRLSPLKKVCRG